MLNARNQQQSGLASDSIEPNKAKFFKKRQSGYQLFLDAANEQPGTSDNAFTDVLKRDLDNINKEIENRVQVSVRVGSEENRVHIKNTAKSRAFNSHRGKAVLDGLNSG